MCLLDFIIAPNFIMHTSVRGRNRKLLGLNSYSLCHKRLGHISSKRVDRLVSQSVLHAFDPKSVETCAKFIKEMKTSTK